MLSGKCNPLPLNFIELVIKDLKMENQNDKGLINLRTAVLLHNFAVYVFKNTREPIDNYFSLNTPKFLNSGGLCVKNRRDVDKIIRKEVSEQIKEIDHSKSIAHALLKDTVKAVHKLSVINTKLKCEFSISALRPDGTNISRIYLIDFILYDFKTKQCPMRDSDQRLLYISKCEQQYFDLLNYKKQIEDLRNKISKLRLIQRLALVK